MYPDDFDGILAGSLGVNWFTIGLRTRGATI